MADRWKTNNSQSTGRDSSPLWANNFQSGGFHLSGSQVPTLVPSVTSEQRIIESAEPVEVDIFLGQESPSVPNALEQSNVPSQMFANSSADLFQLGYGFAPTSTSFEVKRTDALTIDSSVKMPSSAISSVLPTDSRRQGTVANQESTSQTAVQFMSKESVNMYNPSSIPAVLPNPALQYSPVVQHWFYCKNTGDQSSWIPFSYRDTMALEEAFLNGDPQVIATDGGRFDVLLENRIRHSVYWKEDSCEVRRCSWFYRDDSTMKYIPYSEDLSEELEELYMQTIYQNSWHKRNEIQNSDDIFVFHSPNVFVQFSKGSFPDEYGASYSEMARPKVVKRGVEDIEDIPDGDNPRVDHLIFVVHGIGPVCDLRFRGIVECVDDMRKTSSSILKSHFQESVVNGKVGRVEYLPIYWYDALRCEAVGVDKRLNNITLPSIKKLRQFTNEVLLDILFYNSPLYSQSIVDKVAGELNRLYNVFISRNPGWQGQVSLSGHSLGSLVLFDLLSMQGVHQPVVLPAPSQIQQQSEPGLVSKTSGAQHVTPELEKTSNRSTPIDKLHTIETMETVLEHLGLASWAKKFHEEQIDFDSLLMCTEDDLKSIGLPLGPRKKLLKYVSERDKKPPHDSSAGQDHINEANSLHSFEKLHVQGDVGKPHSWLVESASNTQVVYVGGLQGVGLPLVNYPQLDFKVANFFALGSPIAMFLTIRGVENLSRDFHLPTCPSMFNIFHPYDPVAFRMEPLINPDIKKRPVQIPHHKGRKRLHLELKENLVKMGSDLKDKIVRSLKSTWATINDFAKAHRAGAGGGAEEELSSQVDSMIQSAVAEERLDTSADLESVSSIAEDGVDVGELNQGRRIDYVLQEAPLESFNDYLFALSSHTVYWDSEDVALLLMREIYSSFGIIPDSKDHQQQPNIQQSVPMSTPPKLPFPTQPPMSYTNMMSSSITSQQYPSAPPTTGFMPGPPPKSGFVPRV